MKTSLPKYALLGLIVSVALAVQQLQHTKPLDAFAFVAADIRTGRGPGCTDRGTCAVGLRTGGQPGLPDADFTARLYLDSQSHIIMEIPADGISPVVTGQQFVNGEFLQPEDFPLPADIAGALQLTENQAVLRAGTYPVRQTENSYIIVF
jgi:hypothetical protein